MFKRGMSGVYQHCAEKHLHRYLAEFDFRYNHRVALGVNDADAGRRALNGIVGKRLTYRTMVEGPNWYGRKTEAKAKRQPRRKMTKAEQSERFKETARKLGVDESGEAFRENISSVSCTYPRAAWLVSSWPELIPFLRINFALFYFFDFLRDTLHRAITALRRL